MVWPLIQVNMAWPLWFLGKSCQQPDKGKNSSLNLVSHDKRVFWCRAIPYGDGDGVLVTGLYKFHCCWLVVHLYLVRQ